MNKRIARIQRETKETCVELALNLDGSGTVDLKTGVPFLDHMLELFATHGLFDLTVTAQGDTDVDDHHTVEDIAICLGWAIKEALGDKRGIRRYGQAWVPMDEALGQVVMDLSNRPHLEFKGEFPSQKVGRFDTELIHEFFWKLALEGRMNLHALIHYGRNSHHMSECLFKALGRALDEAVQFDPRIKSVPSSKGVL